MTDMKMPRFWGESLGYNVAYQSEYPFINRIMNKGITQSHSEQRIWL